MAYSGWYLPEHERDSILRFIPAKYPDLIAHHVTEALGLDLPVPPNVRCEIVGFADDGEGVQALVVRINGSTHRPMGGTYHITWSLDRSAGFKPVDSNRVIAQNGWTPFSSILEIKVEPRVFA